MKTRVSRSVLTCNDPPRSLNIPNIYHKPQETDFSLVLYVVVEFLVCMCNLILCTVVCNSLHHVIHLNVSLRSHYLFRNTCWYSKTVTHEMQS